ncbi:MAG: O-acetyl-ADP-ribose deacetylase [Leeuwenhoekiella sp.]
MKLLLKQGDITKIPCDAIVNAANSSLLGGGGVDGAIHRAGGPAILEECQKIRNRQGRCPAGEAVITTAANLPAKKVIHTVGPKWNGGKSGEAEKLANCYRNSIKLALEHKLQTVAFPNISIGIYGYPKKEAAQIALDTVKEFRDSDLKEVIFICFDDDNFQLYQELMAK